MSMTLAQMEGIAADLAGRLTDLGGRVTSDYTVLSQQYADLSTALDGLGGRLTTLENTPGDSVAAPNQYFITNKGAQTPGSGLEWLGSWDSISGYTPGNVVKFGGHLYVCTVDIPESKPVTLDPHVIDEGAFFPVGTPVSGTIASGETVEDEITSADVHLLKGPHVSAPEWWRFYGLTLAVKSKIKMKVSGRNEVGKNIVGEHYFVIHTGGKGEEVGGLVPVGEANPYTAEGETAELAAGNYLFAVIWITPAELETESKGYPQPPAPFTFTLTNEHLTELGNEPPTKDARWQKML